eukprot:SAG22_NODE_3669_length_1584_cov_2.862626_1_plen_158_part_00
MPSAQLIAQITTYPEEVSYPYRAPMLESLSQQLMCAKHTLIDTMIIGPMKHDNPYLMDLDINNTDLCDIVSKTRGPKTNWFGRNKFPRPIFDHYFVRPSDVCADRSARHRAARSAPPCGAPLRPVEHGRRGRRFVRPGLRGSRNACVGLAAGPAAPC